MRWLVNLLALGALTAGARSGSNSDVAVGSAGNPIGRIVTLLNGLMNKLEEDLKTETDLFETYKCWYKTTTTTKEASNDAAGTRVDSLKSYIADIEAGKIEFTTERQDLEKQIAGLTKDLEAAKTMRDNEHKDFLAAETEMKQAVSALDNAIKTIDAGTKGSLAQKRSYIDMLSTRHSIQKTMAFTRGLLDASDQKYLEQLLIDGEPKDWKKLNRKATFKNKYKASSGKILTTLNSLRKTFQGNLDDARKEEKEAKESYEKTSKSKGSMLETATTAMKDMAGESGARGVSKTEAQNEVDALEAQVVADTKFVSEAETAFKTKGKEWDARKELRAKEILAMSQAIAVLASDDAKDQMKDSFKSQGYLLLQELSEHNAPQQRTKCAARLVKSIAAGSNDPQLALLALATGNEAIDKVIKKIDEIIKMKGSEEKEDLGKKEKCEKDLSEAASKARTASLAIDTASDDIARASSQIAELKTQIMEQIEKEKGLHSQVKDIKNQRENEDTVFKIDKLADEKAVQLVESAIGFIKDWKTAKKASLIAQQKATVSSNATPKKFASPTAPEGILPPPAKAPIAKQVPHRLVAAVLKVHTAQQSSTKQAPQFTVDAGAAPPPPPATWDTGAEYKGAGEQGGIVGILELVKDDMKKDAAQSATEEKQAVKDFNEAKSDLEGEIKACGTTIDAYTKDKADKEKTLAEKSTERGTKKTELDSQLDLYKSYKPSCDFLLVNFNLRTKARQTEVDGLTKAKAILKGGNFGKSFMQEMC